MVAADGVIPAGIGEDHAPASETGLGSRFTILEIKPGSFLKWKEKVSAVSPPAPCVTQNQD